MHHGKYIKEQLERMGMSQAALGRKIHRTPQTMTNILKREIIDKELLIAIGKVLGEDLVARFGNTDEDKKKILEGYDNLRIQNIFLIKENAALRNHSDHCRNNHIDNYCINCKSLFI